MTNNGASVREFSRSVGKVEQGFPRYASCAASVGTAVIGDEIRRNRSNDAMTRLRSWESGKRQGLVEIGNRKRCDRLRRNLGTVVKELRKCAKGQRG